MRVLKAAVPVFAALALAACGADAVEDDLSIPPAETPAPEPSPAPTPPGGEMSATLNALENSGVTGTAVVEHVGESLNVRLDVSGLQEGMTYSGHIHRGTCSEDRGEVSSIESFTVTGDRGQATASIATASLDAAEQEYFVEIHGADDAVVACGDFPAGAVAQH